MYGKGQIRFEHKTFAILVDVNIGQNLSHRNGEKIIYIYIYTKCGRASYTNQATALTLNVISF